MKNLLFIVPHPDDEIVGCCTIIRRFLEQKKKIFLFFMTNGVISKDSIFFWSKKKISEMQKIRKIEMYKSMKMLGVDNYFFQNIPTRTLKDEIHGTFNKLRNIINSKKIDTIFCPAYEGGHQDHDVANFICSKLSKDCLINEFPEYNFFNGNINCNSFITKTNYDVKLKLSKDEKIFKNECLRLYNSERRNLNYIRIEKEYYRPIFDYDYSKPPHKGTLFYKRFRFFSWHPRVDSDHPEKICNTIRNSKIFNI